MSTSGIVMRPVPAVRKALWSFIATDDRKFSDSKQKHRSHLSLLEVCEFHNKRSLLTSLTYFLDLTLLARQATSRRKGIVFEMN